MTESKRPSLREAARRGVEAKRRQAGQVQQSAALVAAASTPAAPAASAVTSAPWSASFQKVKPSVVGIDQVTVKCGHAVLFELFDLSKDKFRKDRRKKLTDRDCSTCRIKAQEVKQATAMEAGRLRRLANPKKKPYSRPRPAGRLPDGSRFDVTGDAAEGKWSGTLAVPGLAPITTLASGVFKLLQALDGMYRASLPEADPRSEESGNANGATEKPG